MKTGIILFLLFFSFLLNAQLNITQVGYLDLNTMHDQHLNDVWGYVDETGVEYVIAGGTKGTSVVSLSDPSNPVEVFFEQGIESIWRDAKVYNDHVYVTTEAENGLLIIDLTPLPSSAILPVAYYSGPANNTWESAHNLFIDENGIAYIFGANRGNGGVIFLDLNVDPMHPIELGTFDTWYTHDGYAENDTMYCANVEEGFLSVVDVSDHSNPILLGTVNTPSLFTHNVWKRNSIVFTTDEVSNGFIGVYDVSDPSNMIELDQVQSSPGAGVIPHNVFALGDHTITSYYSDGVVVHDASYPYNLIEVGNFDTYPGQTAGYDGCWGVFPYFSSGLIAATDITEGLYILSPVYVKAAYLEGVITESSGGAAINNVQVEIIGSDKVEYTNSTGFYATGIAAGGSYQVVCSKVGYYPDTSTVTFVNDNITIHDVTLVPIPPYTLTVNVYEEGTMNPLMDVEIELESELITHNGITNGLGEETFSLFYETNYDVRIGKWGYVTYCDNVDINASSGVVNIVLRKGYYDDFTFDFNWTTTSTATSGNFVRGEPNGTIGGAQTDFDVSDDCDHNCYVTGNSTQLHPDVDDVDNGEVTLKSPVMDLSGYSDPYLNFSKWFYCYFGPFSPDDQLRVYVDNGLSGLVLVDLTLSDTDLFYEWIDVHIPIKDYVSLSSTMQVVFKTEDLPESGNVTEVAVDHFYIVEASELGVDVLANEAPAFYPNPVKDAIFVSEYEGEVIILDQYGRIVYEGVIAEKGSQIDVSIFTSGVYFLGLDGVHHKFIVEK